MEAQSLYSDDSLSLRDFRRHITNAYLRLSIPWKPSRRKLGVQHVNEDFLKRKNKRVYVENRQRRCQLKTCEEKPTTICGKRNAEVCLRCFTPK
ncbi:hypothetical protein AVEN_147415-1 [Araneus ventricosus]|uniref:Uncharacterized protein n=1 Tax=Araneus ventricosus TaxID=182803 RepID=A0A4Y2DND3_ARAVE|nr:hypothetical protein AVEN_147415-1 [Araneus ventricosus]